MTWSLPSSARPLNSWVMSAGRSNDRARAWRTSFLANWPVSRAHPDLAMEGRRRGDQAEVRVIEERRPGEHVELDDGVDLAALVGGDHRPGGVEEDPLGAVERRLAAPPIGVPVERRPARLVVLGELPGARACRPVVELRAGDVIGGGDEGLGVVDRHEVREVAVRADEREGDRVRVGRHGAARVEDALEPGVAGRHQALHGGHDVGRRERRSVVLPLRALAELERPDGAVRIGRPFRGQARGQTARITDRVLGGQEFERLGGDAVAAEVLHRDGVDRHGALDGGPDPATGLGPTRRGAGRRATAGGDDRGDRRHRQPDDRPALDELAAAEPAVDERFDDVELQRGGRTANLVQLGIVHRS